MKKKNVKNSKDVKEIGKKNEDNKIQNDNVKEKLANPTDKNNTFQTGIFETQKIETKFSLKNATMAPALDEMFQ